jgi:hypothetical protein
MTPFYKVGVPVSPTLSFTQTIRKKVKYRNTPGCFLKTKNKNIFCKKVEKLSPPPPYYDMMFLINKEAI